MLLRFLLALAALTAAAAPASAEDCGRSMARSVSFAEATAIDPATNPCVVIEGIVVGRLLVEDERARYRPEAIRNNPSSTGAILGLYNGGNFDVPTRVRIIGTVNTCAALEQTAHQRDPNAIIMMTGFCHYFSGQVIRAIESETIGPVTLTRLLPMTDAAELGNLSPLAPGDVRTRMTAAAMRYAGAIRAGDRDALAAMHGGGADGRRSSIDVAAVTALLLDAPDSPFAPLRTFAPVAVEIFGWKPPLWADDAWRQEAVRNGDSDAIACFSVRADAGRLWPIDSKDSDNVPGRPYACTRIHIGGSGMDSPASFDTEQAPNGLAEPG
jgi:hypothetical protein